MTTRLPAWRRGHLRQKQQISRLQTRVQELSRSKSVVERSGAAAPKWLDSVGPPDPTVGVAGDWDLDKANGDVYEKTGTGWQLRANITGPEGPEGPDGPAGAATVPMGSSPPAAPAIGQLWIDTAAPAGATQAARILFGVGTPAPTLGLLGDWTLRDNFDLHEKTAATVWTLRGNIKGAAGADGAPGPAYTPPAWANYTPTWTATTNPVLGNGTLAGRFQQMGKVVHYSIALAIGSTTTLGAGAYSFSLPVAAARQQSAGVTRVQQGTNNQTGGAFINGTALSAVRAMHAAGSVTPTSPLPLASGSVIEIAGHYEAA